MKKKIILILIFGLIFRLFISAITFHADVRAFDLGGQIVANGNMLNMYDYLGKLPSNDTLVKTYTSELLIYPPFIYLYHGMFSLLFLHFFSIQFIHSFLVDYQQTLGTLSLYLHLILLKLPYFLFDLLAGIFLMKLFSNQKDKILALSLWVINPVSIFATYMMGQFDIIPTFFVILAVYFIQKGSDKNNIWAALSLGFGMAFKIYPLFLLVAFSLSQTKLKDKVKLFLIGLIPYLFAITPFLQSKGFRSSALVASQTLKSLYAQIPISGGESLILFPLALVFLYIIFSYLKTPKEFLWQQFFVILLIFFIFTHYHPQWFTWVTPFFIIDLVRNRMKHIWLIISSLLIFVGSLLFFDPGLNIGLFSPVIPSLYNSVSIWQFFHINADYNFLRSVLQTVFASIGIYFIFYYFPKFERD